MCCYNSKKICCKQKNGLKSDVCGVCSENVYPGQGHLHYISSIQTLDIRGPFYQTSFELCKFYVNIVRTKFLRKKLQAFYQWLRANKLLRRNKMFVRNSNDQFISDNNQSNCGRHFAVFLSNQFADVIGMKNKAVQQPFQHKGFIN